MTLINRILEHSRDLSAIRRDLHANPELGFELPRTASIVRRELESLGIEVAEIGDGGLVGTIAKGGSSRSVGLRVDMDALPIDERSDAPHASKVAGRMHACGHDGHVAFLVGAARYLKQDSPFNGVVHLIFQPAEELLSGAKAMADAGLFERFSCDRVFGVHNRPDLPIGRFALRRGAMMAGGASFTIEIGGKGSHGARPEDGVDPVLVASHLNVALQSIVSRNLPAAEAAVVSVTQIAGGHAFNVIPSMATLGGTVRAFSNSVIDTIETRMRRLAVDTASAFGATAELNFRRLAPPLINHDAEATMFLDAARDLVGPEGIDDMWPLVMASEDFSFMLEKCPGAFMNVGITDGEKGRPLLHSPEYDFNDDAIPYGAALLARVAERALQ
jgi:amidohydrolase